MIKMKKTNPTLTTTKLSAIMLMIIAVITTITISVPVKAIGYAPIGILGNTSYEEGTAWAEATINNTIIATSPKVEIKNKLFYTVVTVPDNQIVSIRIKINTSGKIITKTINAVSGWQDYTIRFFEEKEENQGMESTKKEVSATNYQRPTSNDFEQKIEQISKGEINEEDKEKYSIKIEEKPTIKIIPPQLEEPKRIISEAGESNESNLFNNQALLLALIFFFILAIFGLRWDAMRHRIN